MRRRGRDPRPEPPARALNSPFADLERRLRARPAPRPTSRVAAPEEPDPFASAMAGVGPLARGADRRVARPSPAGGRRRPVSEEAEALAALSDLVGGSTHFDITDTREYVEGAIVGLDPRVLRRLRRGDYAWQAHLDLHGMTSE